MAISAKLKFYSYKFHKALSYIGIIALLVYCLSAITHPIMAWFGPKQIQFRPPVISKEITHHHHIPEILEKYAIKDAKIIKLIPSQDDTVLLQITENVEKPRRYFDLETKKEVVDYDIQHAKYLGSYFTGKTQKDIKSVSFITAFNDEYSPINRLLPVYKIDYDTDNNITAYIDTEINQLATLNHDLRRNMGIIFRNLHTLSFLDGFEGLRVIVSMILLLSLIAMLSTGVYLLYKMQKRKITDKKRKIHRILAHITWIPLMLFTISGCYHLLHYAFTVHKQTRTFHDLNIDNALVSLPETLGKINDITFVMHEGALFYRISHADKAMTASGTHDHHNHKNKKFDGIAKEKNATYINAVSGSSKEITDIDIIKNYADIYSNAQIQDIKKITFFGMGYDFRNKRLPVYKTMMDDDTILFIDPATGILVERITQNRALENLSFSFLHKWNFAMAFTSRANRDAVIVVFLCLIVTLGVLGLAMKLKGKRR